MQADLYGPLEGRFLHEMKALAMLCRNFYRIIVDWHFLLFSSLLAHVCSISYVWFGFITVSLSFLVGYVVSLCTRNCGKCCIDLQLLNSFFLQSDYLHCVKYTEMQVFNDPYFLVFSHILRRALPKKKDRKDCLIV